MRRVQRAFCFVLIICFIISNPIYNSQASAKSANSETSVIGNVVPTLIQVSAPAVIMFSINPNEEEENRFTSSDIRILNKSNASVKVKIDVGRENFTLAMDSPWKPVNMLPDAFEWKDIGTEESENYIALGVKPGAGNWKKVTRSEPMYVAEHDISNADTVFGEIQRNSEAYMQLVSFHGSSFGERKECSYKIIWSFSLGD
jgi:hypothetical protein